MKYLQVVAGLLISAVALYFAFRGFEWDRVRDGLRAANYLWLLPAVASIVASLWLRAVRWRLLFHPERELRTGTLFGAMNVGYLINDILPLRLGEFVRVYLASQLTRVNLAHALSTVMVERVLDVVMTLIFLAVVLPFVSLPEGMAAKAGILTALAVGALLVMLLAGMMRERAHGVARLVTTRLPDRLADRIHDLMNSLLNGFAVLSVPRVAAGTALISIGVWLFAALALYFTMFAFHLRLPPSAAIFTLALVSISFVIPASPGYVGVFHFAVLTALRPFAVDEDLARSYAIVVHLIAFVPPMLLGLGYVWRSGLSFDRLFAFRRAAPEAPTTAAGG